MATLMYWGNSDGIKGRCDAKCHNAKSPDCHCMCGGRYHGGAAKGDLAARVAEHGAEILEAAKERCKAEGLNLSVPKPSGKGFLCVGGDLPLLESTGAVDVEPRALKASAVVVALLVALLAAPASAQSLPRPSSCDARNGAACDHTLLVLAGAALVAGAADTIKTNIDLRHGFVEQNPLVPQNRVGNALVLASGYLAGTLVARALATHGHLKAARWLAAGIAIDGAVSVAHNYRLFYWPGDR